VRDYSRMRPPWEHARRNPARDGAEARLRFALVSTVVGLALLGDALLYALLPARPGHFAVRVWQVGILLGANRIVRLVTNELAGRVVAGGGGRAPLVWAVGVGSVITAGYALPLGFWGLLAGRLLWGACWSVLRVEGYLSALAVSSAASRGRIFGLHQAATRLGQGGGALIGGLLSDLIGLPRVFLLFGACTFVGLPLVLALPRRGAGGGGAPPVGPRRAPAAPSAVRGSAAALQPGLIPRLRSQPLPLWAAALTVTMVEQMGAILVGRLAADRIGPALEASGALNGVASLTGLMLGFRSFGSLALAPAAGWLGDRLGRRPMLLGLIGLQTGTFAALAVFRPWPLLVAALLLQLVCGNAAHLLVHTLAGDCAPSAGAAMHLSRFSTFVDVGTALGPMAAFALYSRFGFCAVTILAWLLLAAAAAALRRMGRGAVRPSA